MDVVVDWLLILVVMLGDFYYFYIILNKDSSVLMNLMKYLILNDIVAFTLILIHDIPSYFGEVPLSVTVPFYTVIGTFCHCFTFFFALFMLPVFSAVNLIAISAVHLFASLSKRKISWTVVVICYFLSLLMTLPLVSQYCGFHYEKLNHFWNYDFAKPYTAVYRQINRTFQLVSFGVVAVCMSFVLLFMAKRTKSITPSNSVLVGPHRPQQHENSTRTSHGQTVQTEPDQLSTVIDRAFACLILTLCFLLGTLVFNFVQCESSSFCWIFVHITSFINRAKWLIYWQVHSLVQTSDF